MVPVLHVAHVRLHHRHAGLSKAARQEERLAKGVAAVALAHFHRLAFDLERLRDPARREYLGRPPLLVAEALALGRILQRALLLVDRVEQRQAIAHLLDGEARREAQVVYPEIRAIRIARDLPRVMARTEESRVLARPGQ